MTADDPHLRSARYQLMGAWLRRLRDEYDEINGTYFRGGLRAPTLQLSESESTYGSYCARTRTLRISVHHIDAHPWTVVRETLKHEIAHQVATEMWGATDDAPHGPAWRRACERLGILPHATVSARTPIGLWRPETDSVAGAKIRKVHKLLALAENNDNDHELRAAIDRANCLLLEYNLDQRDLQAGERAFCVRWAGQPHTRIEGFRYRIGAILDEYFFVRAIWVPTYLPERDRRATQLELSGDPTNVEMALYVYEWLERQLRHLWAHERQQRQRACGTPPKGLAARNAFWDGVLSGFSEQLKTGTESRQEQGLVWIGDPRLEQWFRRRHPRIRHQRLQGRFEASLHEAGVAAGRRLRIARPIEAPSPRRGRLLPAGTVGH